VKLYEYAAAGVPCVTTRFSDEVDTWRRAAKVADTEDAFVETVRGELEREPDRALLRAFASEHDWDAIAARFTQVVLEDAA